MQTPQGGARYFRKPPAFRIKKYGSFVRKCRKVVVVMSKETAKKLFEELKTNEEIKVKVNGVTVPAELVRLANEAGHDVTVEELIEQEKTLRAAREISCHDYKYQKKNDRRCKKEHYCSEQYIEWLK